MKSVSLLSGAKRHWPILLLLGGLAVLWYRWPIVALDFDLWYHLLGGAYIAEHLALPTGPFFSYLPTENTWLDYYWLYQVIVHHLYSLGGYTALTIFRALVFLASVFCVFAYLRRAGQAGEEGGKLMALAIVCAYALALQPRDILLRPHAITYLFILFVHYIVNYRQRWAWALPVLTVIWVNIHGVEYPVVLLVLGSYLALHFLNTLFLKARPNPLRPVRWPLILSLYAVLATPAGLDLLAKAFAAPPFHEFTVMELAAQPWARFFSLHFFPDGRLVEGATVALVLGAMLGALWLAVQKRLRLDRIMLLAGGLVLLPMMVRFTLEFMVLALPIFGDVVALRAERQRDRGDVRVLWAMSLLCVGLTLWATFSFLGNRPSYPVDRSRLPEGACNFLMTHGHGGRIYNVPNPGGYLQWRLYPKYLIGMDMQTMLFATKDLYAASVAFNDKTVLAKVVQEYRPTYLLPNVTDKEFKKNLGEQTRFVPIYFDDVLAVYVDADKEPELARRFGLEVLDHAGWQLLDFEDLEPAKREKAAMECQRLLESAPEGLTANTIAAKLFLAAGQPAQAALHADIVIRAYPDRFMGYALRGLAAFKEERYQEALAWQKRALARAMPSEREAVQRNVYACHVRLQQFKAAYETLLDIANPMRPATSARDLYDLALAAVASGQQYKGKVLLELARLKTPETDAELLRQIEQMAAMLPPMQQGRW
ncbi:tetratricopeptide repeat protein [Solidesulfovibrio carbinolicus]|uniref:tetratricopeptide repeat protein n=1 Tax=Solidesulfovibrio carbinolicus TaxID=296842 RepID=UPI0010135E7F|nr:tetratricopeptide repeat protein [Solidesulfovibrio carbinolicus]